MGLPHTMKRTAVVRTVILASLTSAYAVKSDTVSREDQDIRRQERGIAAIATGHAAATWRIAT